jgi:hypothetical protein
MTWVTICPRCRRNRAFNHAAGVCYECAPQPKENDMPMCPERQTPRVATEIISKLEADIQKLLAELAAVKSQSLRVVPVGEPMKWQDFDKGYLLRNDDLWIEDIKDPQSARRVVNTEEIEKLSWDELVHPVRLETWEAGE